MRIEIAEFPIGRYARKNEESAEIERY